MLVYNFVQSIFMSRYSNNNVKSDVCNYQVLSNLVVNDDQVDVLDIEMFLSELVYLHAVVRNMSQIEALEPFRVAVEVVALYTGGGLLEADVVKSGKARAIDILYCMVRN